MKISNNWLMAAMVTAVTALLTIIVMAPVLARQAHAEATPRKELNNMIVTNGWSRGPGEEEKVLCFPMHKDMRTDPRQEVCISTEGSFKYVDLDKGSIQGVVRKRADVDNMYQR